MAQEATQLDYLHEVEHMRERVERLERAITEAVKLASPALREVINDLQALRGIADISAVTIAAELGQVSRFDGARQLMGYCGAVPNEDSSGKRTPAREHHQNGQRGHCGFVNSSTLFSFCATNPQ
jgi:transposase